MPARTASAGCASARLSGLRATHPSVPRRWWLRTWTSSSSTPRTAIRRGCSTWWRAFDASIPSIDLIAGNVATAEATEALIERGVDAVKVGIGAGSICTTRVIAGIGVPMITAIMECSRTAAAHNIPVIADGGIRFSGDITKAIAVGASSVMIGNLFAGTDESPGELILYQGRSFKEYRGMGSIGAMRRGSRDDISRTSSSSSPTGTRRKSWCRKASKAALRTRAASQSMIHQLVGGLRAGMGYCGCADIPALQKEARLIKITAAGFRESHVHDVTITKEAPNYRSE